MLVCCYIVVYFPFTRNKYLKVLFSFLLFPCIACVCSATSSGFHPIWFQEMTKLLVAARDAHLATIQEFWEWCPNISSFSLSTFGRLSAEKRAAKGRKVHGPQLNHFRGNIFG